MSKILVERPRIGHANGEATSRHSRRTFKQELRFAGHDEEVDCGHGNTESMSAKTRGHPKRHNKELNENLKPLQRFLRSRVGKPWNKVYSEIMAGLNMQNAVQYHVWQHLIDFGEVETKTYMEGNTVMVGRGCPRPIGSFYDREEFYVHPKTGLLCVATGPSWKVRRTAPSSQLSYIDPKKPLVQYHQIDDVWYEIHFRRATDDEMKKKQFGHYVRGYDRVARKTLYKWELLESPLVNDLNKGRFYKNNWRVNQLWDCCEKLFGGPYLPLRKQQIGTRKIRRIKNLLTDKKKAA